MTMRHNAFAQLSSSFENYHRPNVDAVVKAISKALERMSADLCVRGIPYAFVDKSKNGRTP